MACVLSLCCGQAKPTAGHVLIFRWTLATLFNPTLFLAIFYLPSTLPPATLRGIMLSFSAVRQLPVRVGQGSLMPRVNCRPSLQAHVNAFSKTPQSRCMFTLLSRWDLAQLSGYAASHYMNVLLSDCSAVGRPQSKVIRVQDQEHLYLGNSKGGPRQSLPVTGRTQIQSGF